MNDPILFIAAVLTILGAPGPTNTLLAISGATSGVRGSLPMLFAALSGYLAAILATRLVLGPVIVAHPGIGIALKLGVIAYLGWIAFRLWRQRGALGEVGSVNLISMFVTTLLNPKALVIALSILPGEHPALLWYFVAFALAMPAAGLAWILVGHIIGTASGERNAGIVRRIASVALLGFAGLIAASVLG